MVLHELAYRHPAPPIHQTQPHLQTSSTSHPSNTATIKPDGLHPTTNSVIHLSEDTAKESMLIIPKEFSTDTVQGMLSLVTAEHRDMSSHRVHRHFSTHTGCCHSPLHIDRLLSQSTAHTHRLLSQSTAHTHRLLSVSLSTAHKQVAVTVHCRQTCCCHSPLHIDRLLSQSTAHRQVAVTVHCRQTGCCHSPLQTDRLLSQSTADRHVAVTVHCT